MAKSPETDVNYGEIRNHLVNFLKKQSVEPQTLSHILKDLAKSTNNPELDNIKFNLERFYGEGNVCEPKCGLIRITDLSGGSNFYDKNGRPISSKSFICADDFVSTDNNSPRAAVWIESDPQPKMPCGDPDYRTVELRYIDQSGNIIPSEINLRLPMKVPNRGSQAEQRQSMSIENFQQPFPGCYSLWSEKTLNFVQSKISNLHSLIRKSYEEVETASQRKKTLNSRHIIPSEIEYTGVKSTTSGRICIYQHEGDTMNRLSQLLSPRAPNIQIDYSHDIKYFTEKKLSDYREQQLKDIHGVVLFPTYFDLIDEGIYEDYFSLKIDSDFFKEVVGECHRRGVPVLLMPDHPAISDLYSPIVTDFIQRAIKTPVPNTDFF